MRDRWDVSPEADWMLGDLRDRHRHFPVSDRKLRLFACACGRAELTDNQGWIRHVIEVAERFADGQGSERELNHASFDGPEGIGDTYPNCIAHLDAWLAAVYTARRPDTSEERRKADGDLLRCIVGQPGRRMTIPPLTPTVIALAHAAYHERIMPSGELDLARLAVLADACEEAKVPAEILEHLRGPGPHARGCHAVDLLMGCS